MGQRPTNSTPISMPKEKNPLCQRLLEALVKRISKFTTPDIAFQFTNHICNDESAILNYLSMEDENLSKEVTKIIPKKEPEPTPQYYTKKCQEYLPKYQNVCKSYDKSFFDQFLKFYQDYSKQKVLNKKQIRFEAQAVRKNSKADFKKLLLIVDSALFQTTPNHRLRVTQILALYCFIFKPDTHRVLLQILTGEGKSTTIACLAAMLAMQNQNVDIITTSKLLAQRDADQQKNFFQLMGIKVAHNIHSDDPSSRESQAPRKCYESGTVVYGTPFSYQVDLLYDEYKRKGTRNGRPYDIAIVDEVDSMFVDEKQAQTLLGSTYSGFAQLKEALKTIWRIISSNYLKKQENDIFICRHGQEKGEINKGQIKAFMKLVVQEMRDKFGNDVIGAEKQEFVKMSLQNWIFSAIMANRMLNQGADYIIENDKIVPVDFSNTGTLQKNLQWQNGLHQFLQMKHGLPISVESMTSNFISNIGHFCRYPRIYGLTGTLGSQLSMKFLAKTYNVQIFEIPPFRERRLIIEPGFIMYDHDQWIQKIVQRCQQKIKEKRAVLLICLTINTADELEQAIRQKIKSSNVRKMTTGEQDHSEKDKVDCGDIIIATNIAGRGMDLKASEQLVKNGGLHVIVTFMPENQRIQMQARGRAGRNGAPGSSQLIVNLTEYSKSIQMPLVSRESYSALGLENNFKQMQRTRDKRQLQSMLQDQEKVKALRVRDQIFNIFCQATKKIPGYDKNHAKRNAIEEEWAMFLKKSQHLKLSDEEKKAGATQFAQKMVEHSDSFYKVAHEVGRGINQLNDQKIGNAIKHFHRAATHPNSSTMAQVSGLIMEGAATIREAGENVQIALSGIQKMCSSIPKLQKKISLVQALNLSNQSISFESLNKQRQQKIRNSSKQTENKQVNFEKLQNDGKLEKKLKQKTKMVNISQVQLLNGLKDYIKKQKEKTLNLKENEQIAVSFVTPSILLDYISQRQANAKQALDEALRNQELPPTLPEVTIKKKKQIPWWKRALVFAIGVFQICVGALLVFATSGMTASVGMFMIKSGIQDCIKAVFMPELCADLSKYYGQKAFQYFIAATFIGLSEFAKFCKAGLTGFKLIQNSSMAQVLTGSNAYCFGKAMSNLIMEEQKDQKIKIQQFTNIIKKVDLSKIVRSTVEDEEKLEKQSKAVQQKFERQASIIIKRIVGQQFNKWASNLKQQRIKHEHIKILVKNSFNRVFNEAFQDREKKFEQISLFLAQNYKSDILAEDMIKKLGIRELIAKSVKNMTQDQNYEKAISIANQEIHKNIRGQVEKVIQKYQKQSNDTFKKLQIEHNLISKTSMLLQESNRRIQKYNADVAAFTQHQNLLDKLISEANQIFKNDMVNKFFKDKIISKGKINKNVLRQQNFHPYFKEALQRVPDFVPNEGDFLTEMELKAYNSFAGIACKALIDVFDKSSNSAKELNEIKNRLAANVRKR